MEETGMSPKQTDFELKTTSSWNNNYRVARQNKCNVTSWAKNDSSLDLSTSNSALFPFLLFYSRLIVYWGAISHGLTHFELFRLNIVHVKTRYLNVHMQNCTTGTFG